MRFLILTQYYPPEIGAPQVRLVALAGKLKTFGHDVEVVTAFPHHMRNQVYQGYARRLYMRETIDDTVVHRTWVYPATGKGIRRLLSYLSFSVSSLFGLLRAKKPDYVFVESPPLFLGVTAGIYSMLKQVPYIFNVSDLWPDSVLQLGALSDGMWFRLSLKLESHIYKAARLVNATTQGIRIALTTDKGLKADKVLYLPNGVDTELFQPAPPNEEMKSQLGLQGRSVVLYAGTHGIAQGLDILLDAAKLLRKVNLSFLLVGDGNEKPRLMKRAQELELTNVVFLEPQPLTAMPALFSLSFVSVVPLIKRPLFKGARPSKMFASLASGIPIIFSGEGEAADLVRVNDVGIVTTPGSAEALAEAVLKLHNDPERQSRMAINARQLAIRDYGWDSIVGSWIRELRDRSS